MSVDIKLKHSAVAGKKPDPGQLQNGELALNTKDVKAYIKDSDGNVVQIAGKDMPDNDSRYVQVTGDDMTGDLTLGTDKITLDATEGSATFAGGDVNINNSGEINSGNIDVSADSGKGGFKLLGSASAAASGRLEIQGKSGATGNFGAISIYKADQENIKLMLDGSATFAGDVGIYSNQPDGRDNSSNELKLGFNNNLDLVKIRAVGAGSGGPGGSAGDLVFAHRGDNNSTFTDFTRFNYDGSAEFAGDVAIGDSTTFFGTIGDAVALLPNSIVDQFKTVIDGLPKAQPYGATTLPADLPTPLKDALVRVTTAGKINLNSDGSASFAGGNTEIKSGGNIAVYRPETSPTSVLQQWLSDNGTVKSNQIEFFANGSASFAGGNMTISTVGNIIAGNDPSGGAGVGCMIRAAGTLRVCGGATSSNIQSYLSTSADPTFEVLGNGSAKFAGAVDIESGASISGGALSIDREASGNTALSVTLQGESRVEIQAGGSATFESSLTSKYAGKGVVQTAASAAHGVMVKDVDGNINGTIGWDGSATFTGNNVQIQEFGDKSVISLRKDGQNLVHFGATDNAGVLGIDYRSASFASGTEVIKLNGDDGSASFASTSILLGNPNGYISSSRTYEGNASNVVLEINTDSSEGNCFLKGTTGNGETTRFFVDRDGSATFSAHLDVGTPNSATHPGTRVSHVGQLVSNCESTGQKGLIIKALNQEKAVIRSDGSATFVGDITAGNVSFNLEPDNDANYTTTTEEYTDTEYYTVEVPVVERPGTGTADIQDGVSTADLVDGDERQTQTITKSREVTKTREVKTYTGPTLDVKEKLLAYEERFKQQDAVIAQMTTLLKGLGADVSTLPALENA